MNDTERAHPGRPLLITGAVISVIALASTVSLYLMRGPSGLLAAPWGLHVVAVGMAVLARRMDRRPPTVETPKRVTRDPWPILAPDASRDTCALCALPDLDHYRETAPECVVPYGSRFAHRDCAALRPHIPAPPGASDPLPAERDRGVPPSPANAPVYAWAAYGCPDSGPPRALLQATFDADCPTCFALGAPWRQGCRAVVEGWVSSGPAHHEGAHRERVALAMENLAKIGLARRAGDRASTEWTVTVEESRHPTWGNPHVFAWAEMHPPEVVDPDLLRRTTFEVTCPTCHDRHDGCRQDADVDGLPHMFPQSYGAHLGRVDLAMGLLAERRQGPFHAPDSRRTFGPGD